MGQRMTASLSDQLAALVGPDQMLPADSLPGYAVGGLTPEAVARPATREAVSQVMQWASRTGAAVAPWGGGTQQELGNLPARLDLILDVSRCHRVLDFQPEDLTVTVEAGITLETLQQQLSKGGKHLPLEAPQPNRATIGERPRFAWGRLGQLFVLRTERRAKRRPTLASAHRVRQHHRLSLCRFPLRPESCEQLSASASRGQVDRYCQSFQEESINNPQRVPTAGYA